MTERGSKDRRDEDGDKKEGGGGFIDKVKDFIHDIGEKIEEAVGFGKPSADVSGIHIPHISLHRADLVVDVLIKNPNPVPIPLVDIDYLIDSDGRKLVSGLIPDAGTIRAHGEETVKIPVSLVFDDIKSTYKDIQPGSIIPYLVRVVLLVDVLDALDAVIVVGRPLGRRWPGARRHDVPAASGEARREGDDS